MPVLIPCTVTPLREIFCGPDADESRQEVAEQAAQQQQSLFQRWIHQYEAARRASGAHL